MKNTESRKREHLTICLRRDVEAILKSPGFDDIDLVHNALPELDFNEISTETEFLGKKLRAPLVLLPMTGGHPRGGRLNHVMAKVAQEFGIAFGVGSQRAAIENPKLRSTYQVRKTAPDVFLIGNLGIPQILGRDGVEVARQAVDMIDADVLSIHLNPLQEVVQPEGEPTFKGGLRAISKISRVLEVPVVVKETGAGISGSVARKLVRAGAAAIDVSGAGGTSWAGVELHRAGKGMGGTFWDWGIPTSVSVVEVSSAVRVPVIASGGIRSGVDVAKAIALGADLVGLALPVLRVAVKGERALSRLLNTILLELKASMFLCGCDKISALRKTELVVTGKTREWMISRGLDPDRRFRGKRK